jgi:hypothetical protein
MNGTHKLLDGVGLLDGGINSVIIEIKQTPVHVSTLRCRTELYNIMIATRFIGNVANIKCLEATVPNKMKPTFMIRPN